MVLTDMPQTEPYVFRVGAAESELFHALRTTVVPGTNNTVLGMILGHTYNKPKSAHDLVEGILSSQDPDTGFGTVRYYSSAEQDFIGKFIGPSRWFRGLMVYTFVCEGAEVYLYLSHTFRYGVEAGRCLGISYADLTDDNSDMWESATLLANKAFQAMENQYISDLRNPAIDHMANLHEKDFYKEIFSGAVGKPLTEETNIAAYSAATDMFGETYYLRMDFTPTDGGGAHVGVYMTQGGEEYLRDFPNQYSWDMVLQGTLGMNGIPLSSSMEGAIVFWSVPNGPVESTVTRELSESVYFNQQGPGLTKEDTSGTVWVGTNTVNYGKVWSPVSGPYYEEAQVFGNLVCLGSLERHLFSGPFTFKSTQVGVQVSGSKEVLERASVELKAADEGWWFSRTPSVPVMTSFDMGFPKNVGEGVEERINLADLEDKTGSRLLPEGAFENPDGDEGKYIVSEGTRKLMGAGTSETQAVFNIFNYNFKQFMNTPVAEDFSELRRYTVNLYAHVDDYLDFVKQKGIKAYWEVLGSRGG